MEIRVSRFENRIKEMKMTSDGFCVRLSFYYLRIRDCDLNLFSCCREKMAKKKKAIEIDKRFWLQGGDTNVYKGDLLALRQIKKGNTKISLLLLALS